MRGILFRGKREDNRKWVYGSLLSFDFSKKAILPSATKVFMQRGTGTFCFDECYDISPNTAGQYTGLTDKNGLKIFEGDIVKVGFLGEDYWFEVRYGICGGVKNVLHEVGYIGFYLQPKNKIAKECSSFGLRNDIVYWVKQKESLEVIGNIHDNPEMLDEEIE